MIPIAIFPFLNIARYLWAKDVRNSYIFHLLYHILIETKEKISNEMCKNNKVEQRRLFDSLDLFA